MARSYVIAAVLVCVLLLLSGVDAKGLRQRALEAAANPGASCSALKGACMAVSKCGNPNTVQRGLCPGDASNICCVPAGAAVAAPAAPGPVAAPAAAPAP